MPRLEALELEPGGDDPREEVWALASGDASTAAVGKAGPFPPEARRLVAMRDGAPAARLAFGARDGFAGAPGITGYVGWYAAPDGEAGSWLLREGAARLFAAGAARVVGPMDGSTWHRYRVVLLREREISDGGAFLSEPVNPPDWPRQFEAAGFTPFLDYETRRVARPRPAAALAAKRAALRNRGIRLRSLRPGAYGAELRALHALSLEAFAHNAFYTPIAFEQFEALYGPLRSLIDPELVRLAEDAEGRLIGYVFAFPDALAPAATPRIVLKTLAVSGAVRGWGLGAVLVDDIHAAAADRGAAVLHALMQVTNASRGISTRSDSELFRRYRLYGLEGE